MPDRKKRTHIIATIFIMLVVSRFVVRIVDATVQIDDDIGILILLIVIINGLIGLISYEFYKKKASKGDL